MDIEVLLGRLEALERRVSELESRQHVNGHRRRPTLEEVKLAAAKLSLPESEAERFFNFYESKGWKVGDQAMKSMPHALAGWASRSREQGSPFLEHTKAKTVFELRTVLEAKQSLANDLKTKYTVEDAFGTKWDDTEKWKEWSHLKQEMKELQQQIAGMA